MHYNSFFDISLFRLQQVGEDLIISFKSSNKLYVNKVNAEGSLSWSRNLGDFVYNIDYDLFVLSDQSMLVTWKNYLIYTQLNKDKTSFLQRIDSNGNLFFNTPLGFEYSSKDESYQDVFIHENSLLRFNVEINGQFFKTHLTQFDESAGHLGSSSSEIYSANSADLRIMKVIENNNNVLVIYYRENYSYYRNVLCKLYDQQGHLITENEIVLDYSIYYQRFLDVYTDQNGDFYVIWRTNITNFNGLSQYAYFSDIEVRNDALGTKIQKIDGNNGQILYPQNGILICENNFNCTTVFKDNTIFFYIKYWDYLNRTTQLYFQKMVNDQMLYEGIGQLIFNEQTDAYIEVFVANSEENVLELVSRNQKSISKLLKINDEGMVDEFWQSPILTRELNINTNRLLIKLTDRYLYCYRNDKINCMFLDLNGNVISNQDLLQINDSMSSYQLNWNDRLDIFADENSNKRKYSFEFNNNELVPFESNPVNINVGEYYFDNIFYHNNEICILTSNQAATSTSFYLYSLDENGNETASPVLTSSFEYPYLYNNNFVLDNGSIYATFEKSNIINYQKLFAQTSSNSELSETVKPGISLLQNYPNPFNPSTKIAYSLNAEEDIELNIYNIKGQKVKQLFKGKQDAGRHEVIWNGLDSNEHEVSVGVYFYKLKGKNQNQTRKMLMIK